MVVWRDDVILSFQVIVVVCGSWWCMVVIRDVASL